MPMRSPLSSVTPALSIATSVPVPMAMPTSAAASAGASLTPSPAIATTRPSRAQPLDHRALLVGQHLGLDLGDAEPARDRLARWCGCRRSASRCGCPPRAAPASAAGVVALTGSAMAITPAALPSTPTKIAVAPSRAQRVGLGVERARRRCRARPGSARCRARRAGRRPCRSRPCRSGESKSCDRRERERRARCAAATIARASGCSLARSTLAASRSTSSSSNAGGGTTATTVGLPSVSVPVLSTTSVSTFSMRSSASAFLISTPACAPRPTPTMIDIGVARPSAHGTGDDQHRDRRDQAVGEARLGPEDRPGGEGEHARPR